MSIQKVWHRARALATRLITEDRGSVSVENAVWIGVILLVAAVILGPRVVELVQSLMSKWSVQ
jgi:hypothetical protein